MSDALFSNYFEDLFSYGDSVGNLMQSIRMCSFMPAVKLCCSNILQSELQVPDNSSWSI